MPVVTDESAILIYLGEGDNFRWNANSALGTPIAVTYSFAEGSDLPSTGNSNDNPYSASSFSAFTAAQRENFRLAAAEFMAVAGIVLIEVEDDGMMEIYRAHGTNVGGYADYPYVTNTFMPDVDIVIDANGDYAPGSFAYHTLLHELGHAVGLEHSHDGLYTLAAYLDSTANTVMSYNYDSSAQGLQYLDITALQTIYGTSETAGFDTQYASNKVILNGSNNGDSFVAPSTPDGTSVNTKVFGNGGADVLTGFIGVDRLRGNGGNDELDGAAGNDRLRGGTGDDTLEGGTGNDFLHGGADDDLLIGGAGADELHGRRGNDVLDGGSNNDILDGGRKADILTGGAGIDTFVFNERSGDDQITDFDPSAEKLDFSGSGFTYADVSVAAVAGGVVVSLGKVDITLDGVAVNQIDQGDFLFA